MVQHHDVHPANTGRLRRHGSEELSYDPRRLQGVTVYRDSERTFAQGDRVQLTAPYYAEKLSNCELGTVEQIDKDGNLKLKMDSGRDVEFNAAASASGLRLRGDEPQQPGADCRPRADPR